MQKINLIFIILISTFSVAFGQQELVTYSFFGNISTYEVADENLRLIEVVEKDNIKFEVKKIEGEGDNEVLVPITFNPESDNNKFKIESTASVIGIEMFIFNQWGEFVYETDRGIEGWDGHTEEGRVATGPYIYAIKLTTKYGEIKKISGCVYVE